MIERSAVAAGCDSVGSIRADQKKDTTAAERAVAEAAVGSQTVIAAGIAIESWAATAERRSYRGRSLGCILVGRKGFALWATWSAVAVVEVCGSELDGFGSHYA